MSLSTPLSTSTGNSRSLLLGLQVGEEFAWQRLVELYAPLVRSWIQRSGVPASEVADLAQEVFLSVHRKVGEFVPRRNTGGFRGWLWTIARNRIRDHFRAIDDRERAAGGSTALRWLHQTTVTDIDEEEPEATGEVAGVLHRALAYVRVEFQTQTWDAFWNTTVLGQPTADVAAELGVTPAAVRQSRSRIMRRLREHLGDVL